MSASGGAPEHFDLVVLGAGPAGQKAAVQGAKAGRRVVVVERDRVVGGECVQRGTIPSKTLRESAEAIASLRRRLEGVVPTELGAQTKLSSLMRNLDRVLEGHTEYMRCQLERNGIGLVRGRARLADARTVEVLQLDGSIRRLEGKHIVIATGSRPRTPAGIPVDHEHVLDSDSILSMIYLPRSLCVLGGGVIACEFATLFQALGVQVTIIDRAARPLGFLDPELSEKLLQHFRSAGGVYLPERNIERIELRGLEGPRVHLEGGEIVEAGKVLCALGRVAMLDELGVDEVGLERTERGHLRVDEHQRTNLPHVYAVGDVAGPPALAATAMDQGRRAVRHALGLPLPRHGDVLPVGIYAIPEIACVGETEEQVLARGGEPLVGRASFSELARGQINGDTEGMLKLVCDAEGRRLLGAQVVCNQATELVHLAQLALIGEMEVDVFVDNTFNFPTMAEAYRVAALDVVGQRQRRAA